MTAHLDRLLWRYETGRFDQAKLVERLNAEEDRLVNEKRPLNVFMPELRVFMKAQLSEIDNRLDLFRQHCSECRLREALVKLKQANTLFDEIKQMVEAYKFYQSLDKQLAEFMNQHHLVRELLTFQVLSHLCDKGYRYIQSNEATRAGVVLRFFQKELDTLQALSVSPTKAVKLKAKLQALLLQYNDTALIVEHAAMFDAVSELIASDYLHLASKLIDDISMGLLGWSAPVKYGDELLLPAHALLQTLDVQNQSIENIQDTLTEYTQNFEETAHGELDD
jgi:methyl-accepting chemotaxis protein